ncbi:MCP four helix bundle domain-containing protein [Aneurinibacillus sp. BA2021]|nr:MCP four helix bundle domain-containing protein [Aneurinibacillus sp. BA2021]
MNILRDLKISHKLLLLIILSAIITSIVGIVGYKNMRDMAYGSETIYNEHLQPIDWLGRINANNHAIDAFTLEAMITKDPAKYEALMNNINGAIKENNAWMERFEPLMAKATRFLGSLLY